MLKLLVAICAFIRMNCSFSSNNAVYSNCHMLLWPENSFGWFFKYVLTSLLLYRPAVSVPHEFLGLLKAVSLEFVRLN